MDCACYYQINTIYRLGVEEENFREWFNGICIATIPGITEFPSSWGWQGPLDSAQSRLGLSRLLGPLSSWVLRISKDGDSTAWATPTAKKSLLTFKRNFLYCHLCPLPLVLSLDTTWEKTVATSSLRLPTSCWCTLTRSPWAFSSQG